MPRNVAVDSTPGKYLQEISVGAHVIEADEPRDLGGNDAGPNPYELLLGALGACTSITVRMYAERKQWPLERLRIGLSYARVHTEDCAKCETEARMIDQIEMEISFVGDLSDEQRGRLMEIANKCPVHRTLTSRVQIRSRMTSEGESAR